MANLNAPKGLVPSRYLDGSAWNGAVNLYYIPQADGSAYYGGDVVKSAANADANGVPAIAKALGTDTLRGVLAGVAVANPGAPSLIGTNLDLSIQFIPAVKLRDYYVWVVDDPAVIFEVQDNGLSTIPATSANKNASLTIAVPAGAGQNSATVLLNSSVAVTAALNMKLMGRVQRADNEPGPNAKWLVKINQHELQGATAGI